MNPKLSYFLRHDGVELGRFRTRQNMFLGAFFRVGPMLTSITGLGWEGDRFVVNVS